MRENPTDCFFCDEAGFLEEHHIVPRRYGGSDLDENLVKVCPTCHRKLESLYDRRFYRTLDADKADGDNSEGYVGKLSLERFLTVLTEAVGEAGAVGKNRVMVTTYQNTGKPEIRLHFGSCYTGVKRYIGRYDTRHQKAEIADEAYYREQLREQKEAAGYVRLYSGTARIHGQSQRCVCIKIPELLRAVPDLSIEELDRLPQDRNSPAE